MAQTVSIRRQVLHLAVPAFGALIAEPLFLLADSAMIGHLGVTQLAGLGLASTLLQTAVGLMVFLAYSTTPAVARYIGANRMADALAVGRDGLWLAGMMGIVLAVAGWFLAEPVARLLGAEAQVLTYTVDYLRFSMPGLVAMLLVLAATGVLRGLQDTKTPLVVATAGFGANIVLNFVLIYGLDLSVTGAALGTSIAQWAMAAVYLRIVVRAARQHRVGLRPDWPGIRAVSRVGSWLMLRTLTLRLAVLAAVFVATAQGPVSLAAHQLVMTMFTLLAFALDALAIAAQALIGKELGAGSSADEQEVLGSTAFDGADTAHDEAGTADDIARTAQDGAGAAQQRVAALTRTMTRWGVGFGVLTGALLAVAAPFLGWIFTGDQAVQGAFAAGLFVLAVGQPIAGYVFVLDGVLIGAGDGRYLAIAGVVNLLLYLPLLWAVHAAALTGSNGIVWLWAAFGIGYLAARALTLGWRVRNERWMIVGANRG